MATERQKGAARRNLGKARQAQSARAHGKDAPRQGQGMSTAEKDDLADREFAFPKERKEPLTDARHVRNAIARFGQVEGVSDASGTRRGSGSWPQRSATAWRCPSPAGGTWPRAVGTAGARSGGGSAGTPAAFHARPGRSRCAPVAPWNGSSTAGDRTSAR